MSLAPGTRLGPYEVIAPLGAGGMGEVFRARDTRLGRDVAVKVLPDHLAGDPKTLARFESEARAVAALSHPNILALHDVGEANGIRYAVTELLEGETLRTVVTRGPLPLKRALEIAAQIASALAAAHEKGIVHRDVKPENVFLTRDGHVKLLDFGLARHAPGLGPGSDTRSPTEAVLTETGAVVGTVAYMSPEQARGLPVDHRSDQFSLGVVLYEMLTGRRPFRGTSAADLIAAILKEEPEPLEAAAPDLPIGARILVERCLEKAPEDRYASTRDLALDLGSWGGRAAERTGRGWDARARRTAVAAAALGAAAAAALFAWPLLQHGSRGPEPAPPAEASLPRRVVVTPFENRSGDPSLDPLARSVTESILDELARLRGVEVTARQASDAAAPGTIVSGDVSLVGADIRLQARLSDGRTRDLLHSVEPATASRETTDGATRTIRGKVADAVAARHLDPLRDILAEEPRPPGLAAYQEYLAGVELQERWLPEGMARILRSIELDPEFVSPRLLVAAMPSHGAIGEARSRAELRWLQDRWGSLGPLQRRRVDHASAVIDGRQEDACVAMRGVTALAPGDLRYRYAFATEALYANRPREAVAALAAPAAWDLVVRPDRPFYFNFFTYQALALHQLGLYERELAVVREGRRRHPEVTHLADEEVRALVALGRLGDMEAVVESVLSTSTAKGTWGPPGVILSAAAELNAHGRPQAAQAMAVRAAEWIRARPAADRAKRQTVLVQALNRAGRFDEEERLVVDLSREAAPRDSVFLKARLGVLAARLGDRTEALRLSRELEALDPATGRWGSLAFWQGAIAAQLGEKERAVGLLRTAVSQGLRPPKGYALHFHQEADLEPLRGYPPYEALLKPKG